MRTIKEIKIELEELKADAKASGLQEDEIAFITQEIKDLEKELAEAQKKTEEPAKTQKKRGRKPKAKTPTSTKKPKEKVVFMVDGKPINENDPDFCDKIVESWKKRKDERKKAAGKRKTKPVTQRIAANVASAVIKGIKNISTEEIKKNPKVEIKKMERFEKAGKEFLDAYKEILGESITQKEINEEFSGIDGVIKKIANKYNITSKKLQDGGEVENRRNLEDLIEENIVEEVELSDKNKEYFELLVKEGFTDIVTFEGSDEIYVFKRPLLYGKVDKDEFKNIVNAIIEDYGYTYDQLDERYDSMPIDMHTLEYDILFFKN